jgi:hypothetical protein
MTDGGYMSIISWEHFLEKFKPVKNHFDENASSDGFMFETYGEEYRFVMGKFDERLVWTLVDGDDGCTCVVSGYRYVNSIGYYVASVPYTEGEYFEIPDECEV